MKRPPEPPQPKPGRHPVVGQIGDGGSKGTGMQAGFDLLRLQILHID
ncbi:hypothetical protein EDD90_6783 [Streptomyces sp. Ag109_O5-1]|nr:hypothetical protein [Streptomyces sp. Ag109_O5-1]RPE43576.1 hypothetical protein EDD90_6783 [Streptomyces sp. Ag109_O5-1]